MSEQSREAAIRLVVAVQWATTMIEVAAVYEQAFEQERRHREINKKPRSDKPCHTYAANQLTRRLVGWPSFTFRKMADEPCAVDVVDALWPRGEV